MVLLLTTFHISIFLNCQRKSYQLYTKNFSICCLNFLNSLIFISFKCCKVTNYFIIFWDSFKYKSFNSRPVSILRGLAVYSKALSLQLINSLISLVGLLGCLLLGSYCKSLLTRLFFFPNICLILKSHNWIYTSYFIIKALGKSVVV